MVIIISGHSTICVHVSKSREIFILPFNTSLRHDRTSGIEHSRWYRVKMQQQWAPDQYFRS